MTAVARIWDKDFNLKFALDEAPDAIIPEQRTVTLAADHPAAKWLISASEEGDLFALLTIDDEYGRWCAPFAHWELKRVGSCPECAHCRETMLRSTWRTPGALRGHDFGALAPS